ncbi:MAG: hypothetical protein ETSY1_26820 [Candidatus Entotheonella factor]|uniref:Amidase domain-containing protein n=1 Tax=Entotheonella factor TaxID=1429438 RepID=W4LE69_ENTF1|nr:amidase [Candidatus Entotheonella palauensis]ETW96378.1 MAG: hypothetical protein ETSY1_26820 [Candidatus Entotheonella factor]
MHDTALCDAAIATMVAQVRQKSISPVELMEAVLSRIAALEPRLNAYMTVLEESARNAAKEAEQALMRGDNLGPLHGIPFAVKDLTWTAGVRTTMGSAISEHFVPREDAIPVARLKQAGAILMGKTTTPEYGHKPFTDGPLFGRTINPWDASVTCGGSSGGSAVAVATGMTPFALGTDGGGSVRIPATCCGVVGLKPTLGAVPHIHAPDLFGNNSFIGPMTRSVADANLLFDLIAGPSPLDPYGQVPLPTLEPLPLDSLSGVTVGWMPTVGNPAIDPEVLASCENAVRFLEDMGAVVEPVCFDFFGLEESFLVMLQSALHSRLASRLAEFEDRIDPSLKITIEAGADWTASDLQRAQAQRSALFQQLQRGFESYDFLVSPTLSAPPLPVDQDPHGPVTIAGQSIPRIRGAWYPYTYPLNLTGHPALSLPCGLTAAGLPIGLQFIGPWHSESHLLDVAERLETVLSWGQRPPSVSG